MTSPEITKTEYHTNKIYFKFKWKLLRVLDIAKDSEDFSEWINKIFDLFKRFVNISASNNVKQNENLQSQLFKDICNFINSHEENSEIIKIFNTFPKTSINNFNNKIFWDKFSQLVWLKRRNKGEKPEWWCCHNRSLLLYDFFSQLKNLWLDLEIKFFRERHNNRTNELWYTMKHSWLIIIFQWKIYVAERWGWINSIVDDIQSIIEKLKRRYEKLSDWDVYKEDVEYLINFYKNNFVDTSVGQSPDVIYFDNPEDFLKNLNNSPEKKYMRFYLESNIVSFSFFEWGFDININGESNKFYLNIREICIKFDGNWYEFCDSNGTVLKSPSEFCKFLFTFENEQIQPISRQEKDLLDKVLPFVFKRVNIDYLDFFPDNWERTLHKFVDYARKNNISSRISYLKFLQLLPYLK